jgi:anthranilate phosphoribosyltransferase
VRAKDQEAAGNFGQMITQLIEKVARRQDLDRAEMASALDALIEGVCPEAQMAGLLIGLRVKGEAPEELVGAALALRARALKLPLDQQPMLDTCGTGGDGSGSLNLSTMAAFIAAGAGVTVAKHYNRSASSLCGSADVLESLGAIVEQSPAQTARALETVGIGFLYAPLYHPATRAVAQLRRALSVRTLFNLLGPLTSPAAVKAQLVGVFHPDRLVLMASAIRELGRERALVVSAATGDATGLDEIAPNGVTAIAELRGGEIRTFEVTPADFGAPETPITAIEGGSPEFNAEVMRAILTGEPHVARTAVLINASAALVAADAAEDFRDGYRRAAEAIDSGAAVAKLDQFIAQSKVEIE